MLKDYKGALISVAVTLALTGCASSGSSVNTLENDAARSELMIQINSVKQSLDAADQTFTQSQALELNWYATDDFNDAKEALDTAKSYYAEYESNPSEAHDKTGFFSSTTNLEATEANLKRFSDKIERAKATRIQARATLSEAFSNRDYLQKIDAKQHFPRIAQALEQELKDLIDLIADQRIERATQSQPALLAKQHTLEVKTITKVYLTEAQQAYQTLSRSSAKQLAPKAFSQASASLTDALALVASNPKQLENIQEKARLSVFFTHRAELIVSEIEALQAMQKRPQSHENYILRFEAMLYAIQQQLGAGDVRDKAFEEQSKALVAFIANSVQASQSASQQLDALHVTINEKNAYIKALLEERSQLKAELAALTATPATEQPPASSASDELGTQSPTDTRQIAPDKVE